MEKNQDQIIKCILRLFLYPCNVISITETQIVHVMCKINLQKYTLGYLDNITFSIYSINITNGNKGQKIIQFIAFPYNTKLKYFTDIMSLSNQCILMYSYITALETRICINIFLQHYGKTVCRTYYGNNTYQMS